MLTQFLKLHRIVVTRSSVRRRCENQMHYDNIRLGLPRANKKMRHIESVPRKVDRPIRETRLSSLLRGVPAPVPFPPPSRVAFSESSGESALIKQSVSERIFRAAEPLTLLCRSPRGLLRPTQPRPAAWIVARSRIVDST